MLHLGSDYIISFKCVVAILALDTAGSSDTAIFLRRVKALGKCISVSHDDPVSAIITWDQLKGEQVYLSPISTQTLKSRAEFLTQL